MTDHRTRTRAKGWLPSIPEQVLSPWDAMVMAHGAFTAYAEQHRAKVHSGPADEAEARAEKAERNVAYAAKLEQTMAAEMERLIATANGQLQVPEPSRAESWPSGWWLGVLLIGLAFLAGMWVGQSL